jgi:hypothetical protein
MLVRDIIKEIVLSCQSCPLNNACPLYEKGQKNIPEACSLPKLCSVEGRYIRG